MLNKLRLSMAAVILVTVAALVALTGCGGKKSSSSSAVRIAISEMSAETTSETESTTSAVASTTSKKSKTTYTTTAKTTTARVTTTKAKTTTARKTTTAKVNTTQPVTTGSNNGSYVRYTFRSSKYLNQHFEKHGSEFDGDFNYRTAKDYEKGASDVINNPDALFKYEAEDGDGVYYLEATNEFVILSTDGYIRTYFRPNGGKSYFDRQ